MFAFRIKLYFERRFQKLPISSIYIRELPIMFMYKSKTCMQCRARSRPYVDLNAYNAEKNRRIIHLLVLSY